MDPNDIIKTPSLGKSVHDGGNQFMTFFRARTNKQANGGKEEPRNAFHAIKLKQGGETRFVTNSNSRHFNEFQIFIRKATKINVMHFKSCTAEVGSSSEWNHSNKVPQNEAQYLSKCMSYFPPLWVRGRVSLHTPRTLSTPNIYYNSHFQGVITETKNK